MPQKTMHELFALLREAARGIIMARRCGHARIAAQFAQRFFMIDAEIQRRLSDADGKKGGMA